MLKTYEDLNITIEFDKDINKYLITVSNKPEGNQKHRVITKAYKTMNGVNKFKQTFKDNPMNIYKY